MMAALYERLRCGLTLGIEMSDVNVKTFEVGFGNDVCPL